MAFEDLRVTERRASRGEMKSLAAPAANVLRAHRDDPAQLDCSSGTTGLAKGILHAHRHILAHEEFLHCHDVRAGVLLHGMGNGHGRPGSRRCSGRGASGRSGW